MSIATRTPRRSVAWRIAGVVGAVALTASVSAGVAQADDHIDSGAEALARETNTSVAAAQQTLSREARQTTVAAEVTGRLGPDRSAGSWLDDSSELRIAVTDADGAAVASRAGAVPVTVKRSAAQLARITSTLDRAARAGRADDLQSWSVDPRTNQVVVLTRSGISTSRALLASSRRSGALRVERTTATLQTAAYLYGGREYVIDNAYLCSSGFGARDSSGRGVMVTAGHCAEGARTFTMNGTTLGSLRGYSFPTNDYAAINLSSSWTPRGLVDMYNGYAVRVTGSTPATVGATLCKSGRTTGWTCGKVSSFNNSINYGNGDVVYGLTKHSACVEQGDSGGANMSGSQAQGLSSGGALYSSGGRLVCGQRVGKPNESYFQPVREALSRYGLTLVTS